MESRQSSVVDRTDHCVQFVKFIAEWCGDLDTASVKERDRIRLKLGLQSNDPNDIRNELQRMLSNNLSLTKLSQSPQCLDSTIKTEPVVTPSSRDADSRELLVDFNLSRNRETWPTFVNQLDNLLHMICGETPPNRVLEMKEKLLNRLGGDKPPMIRCRSDLEKWFTQQYMAKEFLVYERQIRWHGEENVKGNPQQDDLLVPCKKKIVLLDLVFSLLHVTSHQFDDISTFMPPVYAKTASGWQCTTYSSQNKSMTNNTTFPDWIGKDIYIGEDDSINLHKFLHSGTAFTPQRHISAKHVIYYFVAKTIDIAKCAEGPSCGNNTLSQIQVYAGKSANEINRRWLVDRWAYCRAAADLVYLKYQCKTFRDYIKKTNARLVDVYLTLAYLRKCPTAVFVVHKCENTDEMSRMEARLIEEHNLTNMRFGLNCKMEK